MNKNRGFTLIELLAVIIILAIIALIAVPVVLNIVANARKSAAADSAYSIIKAGELYLSHELLDDPTGSFNQKLFCFGSSYDASICTGDVDDLDIKGTKPTAGRISVSASGDDKSRYVLIQQSLVISGFECHIKTGSSYDIECSS